MEPLDKKGFMARYWFSPLQMVKVRNPFDEDHNFMVESRHYVIKKGAQEQMPGTVANVYLNRVSRLLAQKENKFEFLSDYSLRAKYYDRIIVGVDSMMREEDHTPAYLRDMPTHLETAGDPETPPWETASSVKPESLPTPPPQTPPAQPSTPPATNEPVHEPVVDEDGNKVHQFELNGLTFKSVTDKDDNTIFWKNDIEISEADYSKAASMV